MQQRDGEQRDQKPGGGPHLRGVRQQNDPDKLPQDIRDAVYRKELLRHRPARRHIQENRIVRVQTEAQKDAAQQGIDAVAYRAGDVQRPHPPAHIPPPVRRAFDPPPGTVARGDQKQLQAEQPVEVSENRPGVCVHDQQNGHALDDVDGGIPAVLYDPTLCVHGFSPSGSGMLLTTGCAATSSAPDAECTDPRWSSVYCTECRKS